MRVYDGEGTIIFETNGSYSSGARGGFSSNGTLNIDDNNVSKLAIYPNPASDILNIQNAESSTIQIFDITGKLLISRSNISNNAQIDVASLTTGTYFVKIANGNKFQTQKLIIAQ